MHFLLSQVCYMSARKPTMEYQYKKEKRKEEKNERFLIVETIRRMCTQMLELPGNPEIH